MQNETKRAGIRGKSLAEIRGSIYKGIISLVVSKNSAETTPVCGDWLSLTNM